MSSHFEPPACDRELNEDIVRLVMAHQFPQLELRTVERLGSGWEYDAYLIDRHLVVRFPRYADVADGLDGEQALLEFVGSEIGPRVAVPKISLRGEASALFPHRFFGNEFIPGVDANDPNVPEQEALASDLGHALSCIHGISPDAAAQLGVGPQKWTCRTSFEALLRVREQVPAVGERVPEVDDWLRRSPTPPAEYTGPVRFIHDDLQPEHIIVSPSSGRLTGIIDWGAALGDPAQDFSFILAWRGWPFTAAVLDAYRGPLDADFMDRLAFLGRVRAIGWLAYGLHHGLEAESHAALVRDLLASTGAS